MLRLGRPSDCHGWIRTVIGKVKKPANIKQTWVVNVVLRALATDQKARATSSTLLFPTAAGAPMFESAFKSAWRRAMVKHVAAGNDSDACDLQTAQRLLAHESVATTQRHYRSGMAKIIPLK